MNGWKLGTIAVHADRGLESCADVAPPIHVSTTFRRNDEGWIYSREGQPTRSRLEAVLAAQEGGVALVYASGQAAGYALLRAMQPKRVLLDGGYFGTADLMKVVGGGLAVAPLSADVRPGDVLWLETPKNPTCEIQDIAAYATRAHNAGARVVVDSTLATPILQQPLNLGADAVLHSATKFLAGHSDALLGAVILKDSALAHQMEHERGILGSVPGSLECWLALRGLRTLEVRVERQSRSALRIAEWLQKRVRRVLYAGLSSHPDHLLAGRQMRAAGGLLAFELDDQRQAEGLPLRVRLFQDATSLGGTESFIDWRHRFDPSISPHLLRLSIGLEDPDDLIADLSRALEQ